MNSLGTALPIEQQRCRELLRQYQALGPAGAFGMAAIEDALRAADHAVMSGDVVAMLRAFGRLKECE